LNDEREEIRRRLDLVELVSQRVRLKRSGNKYSGLCPFHDDKTPSFHVNPTMGRYKCFACGESGDIFTWVMKTQALDFREALKLLADQAGVVLSNSFDGPRVDKTERENQLTIMHSALIFFRNELKRNNNALSYLDNRNLDQSVQDEWELGYAPDVGEAALAIHLNKEGKSLAVAEELFLTQKDRSGGFGDKFRGRVMFPIRDERGDLVGFAGRIIGDGNPKYINSSETPLYHKSRILYGINRAKDKMMKSRHAVLVEGYLDVIACHRAGINEAVASCGTALAEGQIQLIKRFADKVTILYDGDAAGQKAASRALEMFQEAEFPCKIALLPKGDDPDTLLKSKGPEAIHEVVANAQSPFDFRIYMLEKELGIESDEFWAQIPKMLSNATSELELEKHLLRLAGKHPTLQNPTAAISALRREIKAAKRNVGKVKADPRSGKVADTKMKQVDPAEAIVYKAFLDEKFRAMVWPKIVGPSIFVTRLANEVRTNLTQVFGAEAPVGAPMGWLGRLENENTIQFFSDLDFDIRVQELHKDYIDQTISNLEAQGKSRELNLQKENMSNDNDQELLNYLDNLRKHKGVSE
jgi:DNA primase